jgi:hypothetical protein
MKDFLSIEKFKELRVLFILEVLIAVLIAMLISVNKLDINYWDIKAFVIAIGIWTLSSIVDKQTYLNLATLLATGSFMYLIWWIIFNLPVH